MKWLTIIKYLVKNNINYNRMATEEGMDGHNLFINYQVNSDAILTAVTSYSASRIGEEMAFLEGGQTLMTQIAGNTTTKAPSYHAQCTI